jgi:UPF0755 protein
MIWKSWTKKTKIIAIVTTLLVLLILTVAVVVRVTYDQALKPVSSSQSIVLIDVPSGSSVQEIATTLKTKGVIRESWAFEWYVRNSAFKDELKAGTYALTPSQSVPRIVEVLAQGAVATDLVTILPGARIDQVRAALINSGFKPEDVDEALDPARYAGHPALVDKPVEASLEGYLYPESFQKTAATTPEDVVRASLDEMQKRLTPAWRQAVASQGLSAHQAIILASIVEQEVSNPTDRQVVAQVFLKRLRDGMPLQSDVTVIYGAVNAGKKPSLQYDSPYNTFTNNGLPIGPISNVTEGALAAVANPATTQYVFFVAGDDGKTYFATTAQEHQTNVDKYCKTLCN